jgi:succinate-semialdehyde dehydrogenase/glutarate-semialdehyde dehydrogenase
MQSINPATGEIIAEYPVLQAAELEAALAASQAAFELWRERPLAERLQPLRRAAELLRAQADPLARRMAEEMGKPLAEGRAEAEKCAWLCEYYAENAAAFLAPEPVATDAARSYVAYRPLGPILGIMPWNFPLWQAFRFAVPAIAAGNTALVKHAPGTTGCGLAIEALLAEAGLPPGVYRNLLLEIEQVGPLIEDPRLRGVSLTGSTRAGRAVAAQAGAALKPSVLELGGSDPSLILEDADLEAAAAQCLAGRLLNGGQSCIAAKRFIVVEPVRARFEALLLERLSRVRMGDPLDATTTLGPIARADLRDNLHRQVRQSVAAGARCLLGGVLPDGPGFYYPASLLTDVKPGMPAYEEELFGPVAVLIPAADEAEAIRMANDTAYGLGAAVYTADRARGEAIARDQLEAGAAFVNAFVRSDPRLPFGGVKDSGWGRELGQAGIRSFVNVKTVYLAGD